MHNVEIKFELRDPALARTICASMHAALVERMNQVDTYYRLADGRLKRREFPGSPAHATEWIFYNRDNMAKARISHYRIYSEAEARAFFGATEPPVWIVVKKVRDLYLVGGVRVHLDHVEGLGHFLEFEAVVTPKLNLAKAHAAVADLRERFAPALGEPLSASYSDLLAQDQDDQQPRSRSKPPSLPPAPPLG